MYKLLFLAFFSFSSLVAQTLALKSDAWQLVGTRSDVNATSLNLQDSDVLWRYDNASWQYLKKGHTLNIGLNELSSLKAGEGFWIKPTNDYNLSIPDGTFKNKTLQSGWNLLSPALLDSNLTQTYTTAQTPYAWMYENNAWKLWQFDGTKAFDTVKLGQGYWLYYALNTLQIGSKQTALINGNFLKVTHLASESVQNIWNLSFKIDSSKNYPSFQIAVIIEEYETDGDSDIAAFVFADMNLTNNTITQPQRLYIAAIGDNIPFTEDYASSIPGFERNKEKLLNSIAYTNGIITLNLGDKMTSVPGSNADDFKTKATYKLTLVSDALTIDASQNLTITPPITLKTFSYTQKNGFIGEIEIK